MMAPIPKNLATPQYNGEVDTWVEYKKEVQIWQALTRFEKKRQEPALYMVLTGKAKVVVKSIPVEQITGEDGLTKIIMELNKLDEKDDCVSASGIQRI